jgi:hypothetical protein
VKPSPALVPLSWRGHDATVIIIIIIIIIIIAIIVRGLHLVPVLVLARQQADD